MGAVSPLPDMPDVAAGELLTAFHRPVLAELARRGTPFRGALYAGLMLTDDGPRLLEFNAQFGDQKRQLDLSRLTSPLAPIPTSRPHLPLLSETDAPDLEEAPTMLGLS